MAKQRMKPRDRFGGIESRRTRRDAICRERFLGCLRNRTLSQWMRQRLEFRVVFERQVRAFVGFNERKDLRGVGQRHFSRVPFGDGRNWLALRHKRQPMRIIQSRGVALQSSERCEVIGFSTHGLFVLTQCAYARRFTN